MYNVDKLDSMYESPEQVTKNMVSGEGTCTRLQWKQWLAALAAVLPIVVVGFLEMLVNVSHRISGAAEELTGWAVLLTIIGCLIGAILGVFSADIFGRKRTLLATMICLIGGMVSVPLTSPPNCFLIQFIGGINAGIVFTVVPLYISEISDDKIRGRLLMLQLLGIYIGQFIMITVGPMNGQITMNIALIAIPLLFLIAISWFPETPYYLSSKKQNEEAANSLAFFRGIDRSAAREEVQNVIDSADETSSREGICPKILELFRGNNRKGLIIVAVLIIVQWDRMFVYERRNVAFFLGNILPIRSIHAAMIISGARLIWGLVFVLTIDTVGRRRYLLGSTLIGLTVASFATLVDYASTLRIFDTMVIVDRIDTLFAATFILHLCQIVTFGVPLVFIGELFPTNVRSIASSMAVVFGTLLKSVFLIIDSRKSGRPSDGLWVFIPIYLLAFLFILAFVPETKKNSFSDIQDALTETRLKCWRNTTSQYNPLANTK